MSTWMYLECRDHNPPIQADRESGQHYSDLSRIREEVANREEVIEWAEGTDGYVNYSDPNQYFRTNSAMFLRQHPHCDIRIMTEYDEDVTEEDQG